MDMVAFHILNTVFRCKRPITNGYPVSPKNLGEHLTKARMDKNMTIKGLAEFLEVDEITVGTWERNVHIPPPRLYSKVIQFIGYLPFETKGLTLGKQVYYSRQIGGYSQKELAKHLKMDESNLRLIELDQRSPFSKNRMVLQNFIDQHLRSKKLV